MKDDGRLKSLGILLAMIAVIVGFFAMFQRRPEPPRPRPPAPTSAAPGAHREAPLPEPTSASARP